MKLSHGTWPGILARSNTVDPWASSDAQSHGLGMHTRHSLEIDTHTITVKLQSPETHAQSDTVSGYAETRPRDAQWQ